MRKAFLASEIGHRLHALLGFAFDGFDGVESVVGEGDDVLAGRQFQCGAHGRIRIMALSFAQRDGQGLLVGVDIEPHAAQNTLVQKAVQVGRWREFPAGDVDEDRAGLSQLQRLVAEVGVVFGGQVHGAHQDVGMQQAFLWFDVFHLLVTVNDIHPAHVHLQAFGDLHDLAADIAHPEYGDSAPSALEAGNAVAVEAGKLLDLLRELAEQRHPEQAGLFGHGAVAVEREITGGNGRVQRRDPRDNVVIAG